MCVCVCVCVWRTGRQGCSGGTKGPAVWEVIAKIASWQPLHHSPNTWLLFLSLCSLKELLWWRRGGEGGSACRWTCPYLNSHLRCRPRLLASSRLIYSLFRGLPVIQLSLVFLVFSPRYCHFLVLSASLCCTLIMRLTSNDVFGFQVFLTRIKWERLHSAASRVSGSANVTRRQKNVECSRLKKKKTHILTF